MININSISEENVNPENNQPYNKPDDMCYSTSYSNQPSPLMEQPEYQGGILNEIRARELGKNATRHELAVEFMKAYGIKRYKGRFFFFHANHYVQISEEDLGRIIYGTYLRLVEESGNSDFVNNVISELKHNPSIAIGEQNISTTKLAFVNGVLDLYSGELSIPNRDDVLLYSINANIRYDIQEYQEVWSNSTPNFDSFLRSVTGGDESLIRRIWEIIGYVLTPDNFGRSYFVFQGVPGSGKSTLERLISNMFSDGSAFRIRGDDFGGRFSLQGLEGKAVIIVSDLPGRAFSEDTVSIIKQISGRDCISTDVKYSDQRSFRTNAKMLFFTNNAFIPRSMDYAFNSRAVCVPFRYPVDKSEQDFMLDYKLASEIDAITTKAMAYYFGLRERHYVFSGDYKLNDCVQGSDFSDNDATAVSSFINEYCYQDHNGSIFVSDAYELFCKVRYPIAVNKFSSCFQNILSGRFGAWQTRRRKTPDGNPKSCIVGVSVRWDMVSNPEESVVG